MTLVVKLFEHNRWANLRAVDACAALTDAQLDATASGTAGTIRYTLMHIASAEQRYVWRLTDQPPAYQEHEGWPGFTTVRQLLAGSGDALIDRAVHADPDQVLAFEAQGQAVTRRAATIYVQAINHATEHRSQIATIITQQGAEPPDFSGWAWGR